MWKRAYCKQKQKKWNFSYSWFYLDLGPRYAFQFHIEKHTIYILQYNFQFLNSIAIEVSAISTLGTVGWGPSMKN